MGLRNRIARIVGAPKYKPPSLPAIDVKDRWVSLKLEENTMTDDNNEQENPAADTPENGDPSVENENENASEGSTSENDEAQAIYEQRAPQDRGYENADAVSQPNDE